MPIPILVAGIVAGISALGSGAGVALYKNNKHNKDKKQWQDEKYELQKKLEECQLRLKEREKRIAELQEKIAEQSDKILTLTKELHECDNMIETIEKRQQELESFITKIISILFRYRSYKSEKQQLLLDLEENLGKRLNITELLENSKSNVKKYEDNFRYMQAKNNYDEKEEIELTGMLKELNDGLQAL